MNVFIEILKQEAYKITHEEVKGFFRNSFKQMFDGVKSVFIPSQLLPK